MSQLRGGAGVTTITPPLGTALIGQFELRWAKSVTDDLTARALVIDDGSQTIALVVCDLILVTKAIVAEVRTLIETRYGIPGDHVMISATHTHTGPAVASLFGTEADEEYLRWVPRQIADSVGVAVARLQPVRLAVGATTVDGVCFNRRFRMRDGTVVFNPPIGSTEIVESVGLVDETVSALLVEDVDGQPIALWANFALHYVGVDDDHTISADYFGHFGRDIERMLGQGVVGFLTNGASGDINNRDVHAQPPIRPDAVQAQRVARAVASAAVKATAVQPRAESVSVAAETISFDARRRTITEQDEALATRILAADSARCDDAFSFVVGQPLPAWQHEEYAREVLQVARMADSAQTELQIVRIGELMVVGLPGEVFVALGLEIRERFPSSLIAIVGLANDYVGYLPTEVAFADGAYETWAARSAWAAPGTGEAMVSTVCERMEQMVIEGQR